MDANWTEAILSIKFFSPWKIWLLILLLWWRKAAGFMMKTLQEVKHALASSFIMGHSFIKSYRHKAEIWLPWGRRRAEVIEGLCHKLKNPELLCCEDTVPTLTFSLLGWILSLFCLANSFKILIFVEILLVLTYHQLPVTNVKIGFVQVCWALFLHHNYNIAPLKSCPATYWFMMHCCKLYRFNVMIPVFSLCLIKFSTTWET